jgi:phosphate transport system substrate-binding protein
VDFGASDAPMAMDKLTAAKLLQFPTVIGAVVPIVNLDGIAPGELKLTGEILGEIYLGNITKWNDPKIAEINQGVTLPDTDIAPVYRSDGSGTTFVFTSYLSAADPAWKDNVGAATSVQWPAGAGAKGNDGVAGTVKNTKGAIGYVEYVYAAKNELPTAQLKNRAGEFVKPSVEAFKAAAAGADWAGAKDFAASMIDMDGKGVWPIVSATFILLPKDPKDPAQSAEVIKFFDWAYSNGGATAEKLHYVPLPSAVTDRVRQAWKAEIKASDGKAVYN